MQKNNPRHRGLSHRLALPILFAWGLCSTQTAFADNSVLDNLAEAARPLTYALGLIGTPYKFGGSDPQSGLDCSGLVKHVYAETADLKLPRTAAEISRMGDPVQQDQLKPGDLVFFNTMKRPYSHVGIYKGDGKFVHASSSSTGRVLVSDMGKRYWAKRFNGARRILP